MTKSVVIAASSGYFCFPRRSIEISDYVNSTARWASVRPFVRSQNDVNGEEDGITRRLEKVIAVSQNPTDDVDVDADHRSSPRWCGGGASVALSTEWWII